MALLKGSKEDKVKTGSGIKQEASDLSSYAEIYNLTIYLEECLGRRAVTKEPLLDQNRVCNGWFDALVAIHIMPLHFFFFL